MSPYPTPRGTGAPCYPGTAPTGTHGAVAEVGWPRDGKAKVCSDQHRVFIYTAGENARVPTDVTVLKRSKHDP